MCYQRCCSDRESKQWTNLDDLPDLAEDAAELDEPRELEQTRDSREPQQLGREDAHVTGRAYEQTNRAIDRGMLTMLPPIVEVIYQ